MPRGEIRGGIHIAKEIPLTKGKFAIVDDDDYELVSSISWYYHSGGYAAGTDTLRRFGRRIIYMHRLIMNPDSDKNVDHINGDKLDNRRENLRIVTQSQNCKNQKLRPRNTSGFKGVSWDKSRNKWSCKISIDGTTINLGRFDDPIDAALVYNQKAVELFGEYARLNDIKGDDALSV